MEGGPQAELNSVAFPDLILEDIRKSTHSTWKLQDQQLALARVARVARVELFSVYSGDVAQFVCGAEDHVHIEIEKVRQVAFEFQTWEKSFRNVIQEVAAPYAVQLPD